MSEVERGTEWIVDASGCDPERLRGEAGERCLRALFAELTDSLGLHPVAPALWHRFPGGGGVTGIVALSESHLACHSFPETGHLALNLYTCRPRRAPSWDELLSRHVGAADVRVQEVFREPAAVPQRIGPGEEA